jgi:hypothetical protein
MGGVDDDWAEFERELLAEAQSVNEERRRIRRGYRFLGPLADQAVAEALTTPGRLSDAIHAFAQAGCHELILFPCNPDPSQIDELAQALPGHQRVDDG